MPESCCIQYVNVNGYSYLINGLVSSVVQFTQTAPAYSIICPGDRLVLTCVVSGTGGAVTWQGGSTEKLLLTSGPSNGTLGSFFVNINESNSTALISTAIDNNVSVTLDGANIVCLADGTNAKQFTIDVANAPGPDSTTPVPPIQYYIINVYSTSNNIIFNSNTTNTNITITGLPLTDTSYTVTIIPVNVIGYGPSATVNVNVAIAPTMTSSYVPSSSLVTLIKDISTGASSLLITSMSISVPTTTGTLTISGTGGVSVVTSSAMIPRPSTSTSGSSVVSVVSGAVGTVLLTIIIIIILIVIILVIKRQKSKSNNSVELKM
ncbi:PREDICTED: uncharacterized protein PB18E9.04c-like [Amphimedon queenslandica]|uniref:Ig-like domain-containing protein n=1 Tax=Amphimedon queenslandica TaxID=400682 RepID=A0AAN0JRZ9_AMPQE|nr:PREDICTED: uncharacterized protein PB18E9.04c-like [Amphimedon queenslandica]|eukprot:XP_019859789.1 PREDICTED: uncharacterized protein PB18E9.04c-like [Amphimedon queenslandica]